MIDHLVYAAPNLAHASANIADLFGATPTPGGSHVGRGTSNELLALGGATYLEVIGPDPAQPEPDGGRQFGIDRLPAPALVAWCVRPARPLEEVVAEARDAGVDFGGVTAMSRRRPDGSLLEWRLTFPQLDGPFGCALPFLIDWGTSPHPTDTLSTAAQLARLDITHDDPRLLRTALDIIGAREDVEIILGAPALAATIETQRGVVILTS